MRKLVDLSEGPSPFDDTFIAAIEYDISEKGNVLRSVEFLPVRSKISGIQAMRLFREIDDILHEMDDILQGGG